MHARDAGVSTSEDLTSQFGPNWAEVDEWVDRVTSWLNRAIHALTGTLDLQAVVFGGHAPTALSRKLIEKVTFRERYIAGVEPPRPALVVSESSGDAAACGAAMMLFENIYFDYNRTF